VLEDHPELATMDLASPTLVKEFFIDNVWSISTFEFIWFWMRDYVNLSQSSELGKYFVKRKSPLSTPSNLYLLLNCCIDIYGALCYATLLIKLANTVEVEYHKKRRHALYFQCVAESNFDNVVKSEFHEIEARARGEHRVVSAPTQTSTLRMMGSMPPPPPPAAA
jgi:hypothetical protein